MLLLGELTAIFLLVQLGFLVVLVGLVLAFGGTSLLRVTIFPILLLLFSIPPPYFVNAQLSWRMQLLSSWLGVEFLRLLGYSVFLEGNVIDLGTYKLQVVEACSGLRYLYPLMSVGFLMAYMYQGALRWRILLFLATIPLTILMNSVRISAVGILVEHWGSGMADGFMHYFEGWVIFLVCLVLLVGMVWVIEYFGSRRPVMECLRFPDVAARQYSRGGRRFWGPVDGEAGFFPAAWGITHYSCRWGARGNTTRAIAAGDVPDPIGVMAAGQGEGARQQCRTWLGC